MRLGAPERTGTLTWGFDSPTPRWEVRPARIDTGQEEDRPGDFPGLGEGAKNADFARAPISAPPRVLLPLW